MGLKIGNIWQALISSRINIFWCVFLSVQIFEVDYDSGENMGVNFGDRLPKNKQRILLHLGNLPNFFLWSRRSTWGGHFQTIASIFVSSAVNFG